MKDILLALENGASVDDMPSEAFIKSIEYQKEIDTQIDDAIERKYHSHREV